MRQHRLVRAVVITEPGGPEVLRVVDLPDPTPEPGEVLIRVTAAGVNRADLLQRQGHYPPPPGAPDWPGMECSGTVEAVGDGVTAWSPGDAVCALLPGGGYAELVTVDARLVLPVPAGTSVIDAAALPEAACTVWSNVFMLAGLRPEETLLVHGGAGGIGTMAVQLGRAVGARVAVTAGSPEKLRRCADLGAEILVDHREEDFVEKVRTATGGHGADVVLDIIGAKYLTRNVQVLAVHGRLVVIGLQGGTRGELDLGALLSKRAAVLATALRSRPLEERATIVASVVEHVWPLVADGVVQPVVHARLPLDRAVEAHRIVAASDHVGKILLTT